MRGASVHFLNNDWQLVTLPLAIKHIDDKSAEGIKTWIVEGLGSVGISVLKNRMVCLTTDSAPAEVAATHLLEAIEGVRHLPCVCHRLSTVVKKALEEAGLAEFVKQTKALVSYVKNNYKVRHVWEEARDLEANWVEVKTPHGMVKRKPRVLCLFRYV